jgi:hypothetical protein
MTDALTQMTAHLRNRIKAAGIKARVRVAPGGGFIQVFGVTYEAEFSAAEQHTIRSIAKTNGLTFAQGMEIDVDRMTNPKTFSFYMPRPEFEAHDADGNFLGASNDFRVALLHLTPTERRTPAKGYITQAVK